MGCLRRVVILICLGFDLLAFVFIFLALLNGVTLGEAAIIGRTDAWVMIVLATIGILATLLLGTILWLFGSGGRGPARTRIQELERQNQRLRDALKRDIGSSVEIGEPPTTREARPIDAGERPARDQHDWSNR